MKKPHEEARDLIEQFKPYSRHYSDENTSHEKEQEWAKETAIAISLITVDRIIEVLSGNHIYNAGIIEYWNEVKEEINKM